MLQLQMQIINRSISDPWLLITSVDNSAVKFIGIKGTQNYVKSEQLSRSDSRVDNLYLTSVYLYIHWSSLILRYTAKSERIPGRLLAKSPILYKWYSVRNSRLCNCKSSVSISRCALPTNPIIPKGCIKE